MWVLGLRQVKCKLWRQFMICQMRKELVTAPPCGHVYGLDLAVIITMAVRKHSLDVACGEIQNVMVIVVTGLYQMVLLQEFQINDDEIYS